MAATNVLLNPSVIAKEIAFQVGNNLKFAGTVYRAYEKEWSGNVNGWQKGQSIAVRVPNQYTIGTTASVASGQNIVDVKRTITLNQRRVAAVDLTSEELTYTFSRFQEEVANPIGIRMANSVDDFLFNLANSEIAQTSIGDGANAVDSLAHIYGARQYLVNAGAPTDGNYVALHPSHVASLMPVVGTVFNSSVTTPILRDASFGRFAGAEFYEAQNSYSQTFGAKTGGTANVNTAWTFATGPASGTIALGTVNMVGTGTVLAGDTFTVAGVFRAKPLSEGAAKSTGQLRQFVCATTATLVSATAGVDVVVYDGPIGTGAYQNVTGAAGGTIASVVSSTTAITFTGGTGAFTAPTSLMYNKNAFALCVVPLAMPQSTVWGARETVDGITVRLARGYDVLGDVETTRVDMLFGGIALNRAFACKVL